MADFTGTTGPDSWTGTSTDEIAHGGDGADQLTGGGGSDQLFGEAGDDVLEGGAGIDQLRGGSGDDVLVYRSVTDYAPGELIDGGDGFDLIRLTGYPGFDLDLSGAMLTGIEGIDSGNNLAVAKLTAAQLDALTALSGGFALTTGGSVSLAGVGSAAPGGLAQPYLQFTLAAAGNVFDMRGFDSQAIVNVTGGGSGDTVYGTAHDDLIYGMGGDDILFGNDGNDTLSGGAGRDALHGGAGDDVLQVFGTADFVAGEILDGGDGFDRLALDGYGETFDLTGVDLGGVEGLSTAFATARITIAQLGALEYASGNFILADAGSLSLAGIVSGAGNQQFTLADGTNRLDLAGFAGLITVNGGTGADTVIGDASSLTAFGNGGNDILQGSTYSDFLDGGSGNDLLYSGDHLFYGADRDTLRGGDGNDGLYFGASYDEFDTADGGAGVDTLALQGDYANLLLTNVTNVEVLFVVSGRDTMFGAPGGNSFDYRIITLDSNVAAGQILTVNGDGLRPDERLSFDGSAETNGSFRIFGGEGVDFLIGGSGNDGFFFGANANFSEFDRVTGGGGTDAVALRGNYAGAAAVTLQDTTLSGVEVLTFLSGHTNEYGGPIRTAGYDYDLTLADGNVAAGQRLDVIASNLQANESLRFDARAEQDGTVRILSGAGDDILYGSAGNDLIYGGLGSDQLDGSGGIDTYVYRSVAESTAASQDWIWGFATGDKIDLSQIDAISGTSANDAFTFIGNTEFGHHAGELRAYGYGTVWMVEGDVNGDGMADFVLAVGNGAAATLTASDFIL